MQGWQRSGGARGAGRQKWRPLLGRGALQNFGGAEIQNRTFLSKYQTRIPKFTTILHYPRKDVNCCIRNIKECM